MLKLFCAPNTISVAVAVALNESGIHWEPILVDVAGGEQTREPYLSLNPKGRVPVLLTPEGPLTETGAILEYLAETAMPGYVPADPLARGRMREVMFYLASTMHVNHAHNRRGARWADDPAAHEAMRAKVPETMAASAAHIEALMTGPYLFGADLSLADFYLFAICLWLEGDGVDIAGFPRVADFMAAMEDLPGVRKTRLQGLIA